MWLTINCDATYIVAIYNYSCGVVLALCVGVSAATCTTSTTVSATTIQDSVYDSLYHFLGQCLAFIP